MSGGQLVVLDRLGRDVKRFPLAEGVVTLGSDHSCDIRFMLDAVDPHHATVAVHANQTVVRAVCGGSTLVNGRPVSVAALCHGDVLSIGGRQLRWDYARPDLRRLQAPQPALYVSRRKARAARRGSGPAPAAGRDPALQAALEMSHRASMPANAGGKQVAIVQPQRRDTSEQIETSRSPRQSRSEADRSERAEGGRSPTMATLWIESRKGRRSAQSARKVPLRTAVLRRAHSARKPAVTKIQAPLGIDHTKQAAILLMTGHTPKSKFLGQKTPSPNLTSTNSGIKAFSENKSTGPKTPKSARSKTTTPKSASPKASTSKLGTTKSASLKPETPQPASPKSGTRRSASFVVKKKSPIRRSIRGRAGTGTPQNNTVILLDTTESDGRNSTHRYSSRRSGQRSFEKSPLLPSPKKSALKNPLAKKSMRKTESIKFDLSNLESHSQESEGESGSEDDLTLHYSETPSPHTPSPRRSIHSRSSRILEKTLDTTMTISPPCKTLTPVSPRSRKSLRGSLLVQKALNKYDDTSTSHRSHKSASPFKTRTLSPRSPQNDLESYSIVDLVSVDSSSMYDSATSATLASASPLGTPVNASSRKTKSTIDSTVLGSSTPYVTLTKSLSSRSSSASNKLSSDSNRLTDRNSGFSDTTRVSSRSRKSNNGSMLLNDELQRSSSRSRLSNDRSRLSSNSSKLSSDRIRLSGDSSKLSNDGTRLSSNSSKLLNDETRYGSILSTKSSSRKTKSLSTPENASIPISLNSTRISRVSRSRSRINDSDLFLVEPEEAGDSPRSSKRISSVSKRSSAALHNASDAVNMTPNGDHQHDEGISTPENTQSPEEASTPVLSIQSLLDSSHGSIALQSARKRGRPSQKRKTFAVFTGPKTKISVKSKSMNFSPRKIQLRLSNDSYENMNISEQQDGEVVTPKSAVKLVQEAVKNKHSTAKKPQSKRSIIDDLNESDIVKQLFNSPVKRKLSQSMTEFSRKQLFDDDDIVQVSRPTRNTVVLGMLGRSPDDSLLDRTEAFTPEQFVSPMSTPSNSPNLAGIKRLFAKKTPENDLREIKGVKALLRTPRARKSIRNDLTDVAGVKAVFAAGPRNRLSDVRIKEVFAASPNNDLRRVSGVKSLFLSQKKKKSPRNSLTDVRGVRKLFNIRTPKNDLRKVSGVKRVLQRSGPRNDLSDVRGVKRLFKPDKHKNELSDMSGVEELFNESNQSHRDAESLFGRLVSKPTIKAVYSKTFCSKPKPTRKKSSPKSKSLLEITLNPEEWLEQKLKSLLEKKSRQSLRDKDAASGSKTASRSKLSVTRELQKLATATVEGSSPLLQDSSARRGRRDTTQRSTSELYSAHKLPLKKRSFVDRHAKLPLKKRAVLHSTPVKGRQLNMTINASELGRVSPIACDDDEPKSTYLKENTEVRPKSRRATRAKPTAASPGVNKPSPKQTRGKSRVLTPTKTKTPSIPTKDNLPAESLTESPAKKILSPVTKPASNKLNSPKPTRSRRTAPVSPKALRNTKNRRSKLVVLKKSPVMSPQPRATRKRKDLFSNSEKPYGNKDEKVKTPKNTRTKVQKLTVVISKPSPQLKPRATRGKANKSGAEKMKVAPKAGKPKETRKADVKSKKNESPKKSSVRSKSPKVVVEILPKTRGKRKTALANKSKQSIGEEEKVQPQTRRGRPAVVEEAILPPRKTRKTDKRELVQEQPKVPTKTNKKQEKPAAEAKVTRGKRLVQQESVQSEPTSRSRKGAKPETSKTQENTRKRKTVAVDDRPAKLSKKEESEESRGRRRKIESPKLLTANVSQKSFTKAHKETTKNAIANVPKKGTRSKKVEFSGEVPLQKSTRGKKRAIAEVAPEVGKRKRKTVVESPPVEEVRKTSRRGKMADATPPPPGGSARRTRRR